MRYIVEIAILTQINKTFDYLAEKNIKNGSRVKIPFGSKIIIGFVVASKKKSNYPGSLKKIVEVIDDKPLFDKEYLKFLYWISKYYHHPIGDVISTAIPKNLRLGNKLILKNYKAEEDIAKSTANKLNVEQQQAVDTIINLKGFNAYLLNGITGSGKTEIYIQIAEHVLNQGRQVLILVPEIGLTPQMITRFRSRINKTVVIMHSKLSAGQKLNSYILAKENKAAVILGTRSAIFSQIPNLGFIIIDEEHDSSFKQQSGLRYSARDLAYVIAKQKNISLLLGSATPSLESIHNVNKNKLTLLNLTKRAGNAKMPQIKLIDMNIQKSKGISEALVLKIKSSLNNHKQVLLFINRRGYAPVYFCTDCNWRHNCNSCQSGMVFHKNINRLICHHCLKEEVLKTKCPNCNSINLEILGHGTQRIEDTIYAHFPNREIIRIDRDTTTSKEAFQKHLDKINSGKPCIIIGTQMLAKGHDFENIQLVGILDIDISFLSIDFRATEKLAQLLLQVSGRAGRCDNEGEVYIQTKNPNNPIFSFIKNHNYYAYAKKILIERKKAELPPYSYQALICANAKVKKSIYLFLNEVKILLEKTNLENTELLGPVPALIEKKANYYYAHLWLQNTSRVKLHKVLNFLDKNITNLKSKNKVRWYIDIDPIEI